MVPEVEEVGVVQMLRVRSATTAAAERGSRRGRGADAHRRRVVLRQTAFAAEDVSAPSAAAAGGCDGDRGRRGPRGVGRFPRHRRAVGLLSLRSRRGVVEAVAAVEL